MLIIRKRFIVWISIDQAAFEDGQCTISLRREKVYRAGCNFFWLNLLRSVMPGVPLAIDRIMEVVNKCWTKPMPFKGMVVVEAKAMACVRELQICWSWAQKNYAIFMCLPLMHQSLEVTPMRCCRLGRHIAFVFAFSTLTLHVQHFGGPGTIVNSCVDPLTLSDAPHISELAKSTHSN